MNGTLVHGRRQADLAETLRILPTLVELGFPVLTLSLRNHGDSTSSPSGRYSYGAREWKDVVSGIDVNGAQGTRDVVLYGFSFGAATILEAASHLAEDPQGATTGSRPSIRGLVLDAPLLDVPSAIVHAASTHSRLPFVAGLARLVVRLAGWRDGIDWVALDKRLLLPELGLPTLVFHGTDDPTVPIVQSDKFVSAAIEGGIDVRFERVEGGHHADSWNVDPDRYEHAVSAFLEAY